MDKQMAALNVVGWTTLAASSTQAWGLDSAAAATALVGGKFGGAIVRRIFITAETATGRWRGDGGSPTTTAGHALASGDSLSLTGANYKQLINNLQFIAVASTCNLTVTYFD